MLSIEGLTKIYGDACGGCLERTGPEHQRSRCPRCGSIVACAEVSLELGPGEIVGIVGESGSGKTTLARCLALDVEATAGRVLFGARDGRLDLLGVDPARRRALRNLEIAMVHQDPQEDLDLDVTAGGNVVERLLAADWRHVGAMRARSADLLARTEITERVDEPSRAFSSGMRQRIQLARALANRPSLLLLDEPTAGLDVSVQARIIDLVRSIQRETGVATVVISHDLGVIRLLAQRTLVIRHGRVVEHGLTDQVLEDPQHPYSQLLVNSDV